MSVNESPSAAAVTVTSVLELIASSTSSTVRAKLQVDVGRVAAAVGDANLAALDAGAVVELVERDPLVDEAAEAERERAARPGRSSTAVEALADELLGRGGLHGPDLDRCRPPDCRVAGSAACEHVGVAGRDLAAS